MIYTFGYTGNKPADLKARAERLDAVVVDIRLSPNSRVPHWRMLALQSLLGNAYVHIRELGNENYKGGPIKIHDLDAGIKKVLKIDKPVILMCACKDFRRCHRREVAAELSARGYLVAELTL